MPANSRNQPAAQEATGAPASARPTLGRPLSLHLGPRPSKAGAALFIIISLLAVLAPLGFGAWRSLYAYTTYGLVAADFWGRPWFYVSIVAVVIVVLLALDSFTRMRRFAAVHVNGLRLRPGFSRIYSRFWSEIDGLSTQIIQERFLHLNLRTSYQITLHLKDGLRLRLRGPLENMPELIQSIKDNLYPQRLPELRAAYQSGAWVSFGPLSLQSDGLALPGGKGTHIPWEQVLELQVQNGDLVVQVQDRPATRIPVSEIPNLELMLDLSQQEPIYE